jgi:hypothetical protein
MIIDSEDARLTRSLLRAADHTRVVSTLHLAAISTPGEASMVLSRQICFLRM